MLKIVSICCLIFSSCFIKQGFDNDCITVDYNDTTEHFRVVKKIVFDTTASLVHFTVIDVQSKKLLSNVQMQIIREDDKIMLRTAKDGTAQVFQNGIEGIWDIKFSVSEYSCLTIKKFVISGGQIVSVKLRKRQMDP